MKYGWKSERAWGRGVGVGDNMSGLVWVMEWTSVLILHIPKKKKIQGNKEEEPRNKRSQYINHSENKLTIHLLDFYRNLPLNHEVHA